uniref:Uncharacterized protein n=1 Tax=Globodera rostochiensis TaxID=31243 RepID=A0A914HWS2_GLORO
MCLSRVGQIAYGALALASVGLIIGSIFTPAWRQVKSNLQQGQLNQLPPLDMGLFAFACQRDNSGYINTSPIYGGNYGNINQQQQLQQQGMYTTGYPSVGQQISNNGINQAYNTLNSGYNTVTGQQQAQYATQYGSGTGATLNTFTGTRYVDMCLDWWNNQPVWEKVVICLMLIGLISAVLSLVWDLLTFCACFCPGSIMKPLPGLASTAFVALLLAVIVYYVNNQSSIDIMRATSQLQQLDNQSNVSYSFFLAVGATIASLINIVVGSLTLNQAKIRPVVQQLAIVHIDQNLDEHNLGTVGSDKKGETGTLGEKDNSEVSMEQRSAALRNSIQPAVKEAFGQRKWPNLREEKCCQAKNGRGVLVLDEFNRRRRRRINYSSMPNGK